MDVFIYSSPGFGRPRDEIEDAIEEFLGYKGEVTGGGSGESGSNIDVEVFEVDGYVPDPTWVVGGLREILTKFQIPTDSVIVINERRFPVYTSE